MSHSRIFKVEPNYEDKGLWSISEAEYESNGFVDNIADYVDEDTDWIEDYQWLAESYNKNGLWTVSLEGETEDENTEKMVPLAFIKIHIDKCKEWLDNRAKEVAKLISEDPKNAFDYKVKMLTGGDRSGFWFDVDGWGYMTDVEFVKYCVENYAQDVKFRLEGTLDYHS